MVFVDRSARMGIRSLRIQAISCRARARWRASVGSIRGVSGKASSRYSTMALDSERWKSPWRSIGTRAVSERRAYSGRRWACSCRGTTSTA